MRFLENLSSLWVRLTFLPTVKYFKFIFSKKTERTFFMTPSSINVRLCCPCTITFLALYSILLLILR